MALVFGSASLATGQQPARPEIEVVPALPIAGEPATFSITPVPDPAPTTVEWHFDDGTPDGTGLSVSHTFADPGTYDVSAVVDGGRPIERPGGVTVNARPVADFTFAPTQPDVGESVLFVSSSTDGDDSIAASEWDFGDGTPVSGSSVTHSFSTSGTKSVTLTVTDQDGTTGTTTENVTVVEVVDPSAGKPTASFTRSATIPVAGANLTFNSTSTPSSGQTITSYAWDVDGDGFDDGSTASITRALPAGTQTVRLQVSQSNGQTSEASMTFRVNAPPTPGFIWTPGSPVGGAQVELVSTSVDPEGPLSAVRWDLDDDGQFDDGALPSVRTSFAAGTHEVSLRAVDSDGVVRDITRTISVGAAPVQPTVPMVLVPAVIRLAGRFFANGARISALTVRGPKGARVRVTCTGRSCPFEARNKRIARSAARFRGVQGRFLRGGVRIKVYVRAPGFIGKYSSWLIRNGRAPKRTDRCLPPGSSRPTRCAL